MVGYLDTSALVPLLIAEPSSPACRRFWDDADTVVSCRLLYVEAAAALAQAYRMHRLGRDTHASASRLLDDLWEQIDIVEIDDQLVRSAAALTQRLSLHGSNAIHCASAARLVQPQLVAAARDDRLLQAWQHLGISTFDTNL